MPVHMSVDRSVGGLVRVHAIGLACCMYVGVYTQLLRRWYRHNGALGMFLLKRLALRDMSSARVQEAARVSIPQAVVDAEMAATIDVPDELVDEGQLWGVWTQEGGSLQSQVWSSAEVNNTRSNRGLVRAALSDGSHWLRSHEVIIGDVCLPGRTLSSVRTSAWEIENDAKHRRLSALLVNLPTASGGDGQVFLLDGMAQLVSFGQRNAMVECTEQHLMAAWTEQRGAALAIGEWALVGQLLGTPYFEDVRDPCGKVHMRRDSAVQLVPVDAITQLVGLIRSGSDGDVCLVAQPNKYFYMINLSVGVMRYHRRRREIRPAAAEDDTWEDPDGIKTCHLPELDELIEDAYDGMDEPIVPKFDGWATGLDHSTAPDLPLRTMRSLLLLSKLKPSYHQQPGIAATRICKELLPGGTAHLWEQVLAWRQQRSLGLHDLSFVELGSGIGGVVMATHILMPGNVSVVHGVELEPDLHDKMLEWLLAIDDTSPRMQHTTDDIRQNMLNDDFITSTIVHDWLHHADVVFCNNYLFDAPPQDQPNKLSLNARLSQLICTHLTHPGACVVTTTDLGTARRGSSRAALRGGRGNEQRVLQTSRQFDFAPSHVSWHGRLRGHLSSFD